MAPPPLSLGRASNAFATQSGAVRMVTVVTKTLASLAVALACLTLLAGCNNKEKQVEGKWHFKSLDVPGAKPDDPAIAMAKSFVTGMTIEFKSDHKFTMSILGQAVDGDWKLNDKSISITPTTIGGQPVAQVKQQMSSMMKANPKMANADPGATQDIAVSDDGKTLTMSGKTGPGSVTLEKDAS
jgi:hypothetical protein